MGIGFLRSLTKRYIFQISEVRSIVNSGVRIESPFLANQQKFNCYHKLNKIRVPETSCPFISPPFNSYSYSSSSSYSKIGFLGWYLRKLETRPIITKGITSSLIFAAADLTAQMITLPSPSSFDLTRTARMAGYGMIILGPAQHMWFNFVAIVQPRRDVVTTLKKLVMGQVIFGPIINTIFFSFNAILQGESGGEIVARLKRDLLRTLLNGLMYWPLCDFLTYKTIPVHLQPLMNSSFSYLWTIYLTYMASLKKPGAD